ncbi:haloacid dehalogenase type II [Lutibaculum baratangense]|uniref:(S)-2-haloacid dehalogenase n=1 Tax=Lutibaculum baratangense AMV1 TaxID=631454 RepID=V4QYH7_9HYPH|nr:haloacid dehalogenase type II [Lutibaculum baratangense]ESR24807.1 haloacid dehalogenase, type II [Lutibaculum baratangense AMV1]
MIDNIKACVFDAYGTLFDVHSPVARSAESLGEKADPLSRLWREKQLQYTWLRSLMGLHADFWQITGDALDYAMNVTGADRAMRDRLLEAYLTPDAYGDALPALRALKEKGKTTAILSNGSPRMLESATRTAGLCDSLDAVLSIEEVGVYKPHPKVYRLACDRLGCEPAEICFVSMNPWDASGAAAFGLRVARINRFDQPGDVLPGEIAAVIYTLEELPDLVA